MASTRVSQGFNLVHRAFAFSLLGGSLWMMFGMASIHRERVDLNDSVVRKQLEYEERMRRGGPEMLARRKQREQAERERAAAEELAHGQKSVSATPVQDSLEALKPRRETVAGVAEA